MPTTGLRSTATNGAIGTTGTGALNFQNTGGVSAARLVVGADAAAGAAAAMSAIVVQRTGIADNTATDLLTITVPNSNQSAGLFLEFVASLGAGTDTYESTRTAIGAISIERQTGANAVAVATALYGLALATSAGGGTLTFAYAVSAIAGAVGAVNTFTVTVTCVKTGTVTDHSVTCFAKLLNQVASGVTVAASP